MPLRLIACRKGNTKSLSDFHLKWLKFGNRVRKWQTAKRCLRCLDALSKTQLDKLHKVATLTHEQFFSWRQKEWEDKFKRTSKAYLMYK